MRKIHYGKRLCVVKIYYYWLIYSDFLSKRVLVVAFRQFVQEVDAEDAAFAGAAVYLDAATVFADDFLADGESEARALFKAV